MCKSASFKVRKNQVFFSKYSDSHSVISKENKIPDDESSVSVEITPPNNDYSLPFDKWKFKIDSNYPLPKWWCNKWAEEQCRELLPTWAKMHIYRDVEIEIDLTNVEQPSLYFFNCKIKLTGQTGDYCGFYDNSTGTVTGQTGDYCGFYGSSKRI